MSAEALMQKNRLKDRILSSPLEGAWKTEPVVGSFYMAMYRKVEKIIDEKGDWDWLNNVITGEKLSAVDGLTYGKRFAVAFRRLGLAPGDVVHMVVGNFNLAFSASFGTWICGGVVSVGDVALEARAVALQLKDTQAKIVLCVPETSDLVERAVGLMDPAAQIKAFCFGEVPWCKNIYDLLKESDPTDCPEPYTTDNVKDETSIVFWSSGTTGHPKGITHTHFTNLNFGGLLGTILTPDAAMVTTTCFFHVGGFYTGIYALMYHQYFYHMFGPGFKLEHLLSTITARRPKQIALGTHHYVQLSESDILKDADPDELDSVEMILPAGAAVPQSCQEKYTAKMRNLKTIINAYGQTEMGIATMGLTSLKLGCVMPCVRIKIENPDTGERCGPGEVGEICSKNTFGMMKEYLNRPKETKEFFDFEGFGHSGDLGYYDEDGELYYVDRMKEIIKYKNNHVSPTELEDIMQRHPAVQESLAFGRPDPQVQEVIAMVVVLIQGKSATEEELTEHVNSRVTDYKRIRGGVIFRDEIPRNSVGKLVRRDMREWAKKQAKK